MKKILLVLFSLVFLFIPIFYSKAAGASLYFSPDSGSFTVGDTFNVSVFVNTGGENINAINVNIKFDPKKIQVASPSTGKSFIKVWISQPVYSNEKGLLNFVGGIPSPGINTTAGLVSTITFRALSPGKTSIWFTNSSKVLRNDSKGTNILTSMGRGVYNLLIPSPSGPKVFSPTHPDENKWYSNNNITFSWTKDPGVTNFSYSFDHNPVGTPDNKPEGNYTSVSYSNVKDGIWYFHIKAEKGNVWGGVSHYSVQIDATPPAVFTPKVKPSPNTDETQPLIYFVTTDNLSGLDYYQIKCVNITPGKGKNNTSFFIEANSPYKLSSLDLGKYLVIVKAVDRAGNYREGAVRVNIFPKSVIVSKHGVQWREISIQWMWLIIILVVIILSLIIFCFWRRQKREHLRLLERKKRFVDIRRNFDKHRKIILGSINKQDE